MSSRMYKYYTLNLFTHTDIAVTEKSQKSSITETVRKNSNLVIIH